MNVFRKYRAYLILIFTAILVTYIIIKNGSKIVPYKNIDKKLVISNFMESTPFVWKNKLYYLVSERNDKDKIFYLAIYDYDSKKRVSPKFGNNLSLGSLLVDNETIYVYGTKNWTKFGESEIFEITSRNMKNFSKQRVIYKAHKDQRIFNTSLTKNTSTGKYVMSIESDEDGLTPFSIRFLKSKDLINWSLDKNIFGKKSYVACPTIKYIGGYYYLLFGAEYFYDPNCLECKKYITKVSRSKDLSKWETSIIPFLIPENNGKEGLSTADADLVEYKDKTYIHYSISDQSLWGKLREAEFNGSTKKLLESFFE